MNADIGKAIKCGERSLRAGARLASNARKAIEAALRHDGAEMSTESREKVSRELRHLARIEAYALGALSRLPDEQMARLAALDVHLRSLDYLASDP
jgi:hypothetical protein